MSSLSSLQNETVILIVSDYTMYQVLSSSMSTSRVLSKCFETIRRLNQNNTIKITWCNSDSEDPNQGTIMYENHMAAHEIMFGPHPSLPRPYNVIKDEINKCVLEEINKEWETQQSNRTSKLFIEKFDIEKQSYHMGLKKIKLRNLTFIISGHAPLNEHLHRIGLSNSPFCTCCPNKLESVTHYLCECQRYIDCRKDVLEQNFLQESELRSIDTHQLLKYIKRSSRMSL